MFAGLSQESDISEALTKESKPRKIKTNSATSMTPANP